MTNADVVTTSIPPSVGSIAIPSIHESLLQRAEHTIVNDAKQVLTVMEAIGRDCLKVLASVQPYLPEAAALATAIFPAEAAGVAGAANSLALIQNAVATVEAKWAAGGAANKNGAQKFADVLAIVEPTVLDLLSRAGIHADRTYVTNLINIVVGILNVRTVSGGSATPAAATA